MHNIICNFITISYAISKNDVMFFYTRITLQFNAWSIVSFLFYFYDIIYAYLLIRLNVYQSIEHTITAPRGAIYFTWPPVCDVIARGKELGACSNYSIISTTTTATTTYAGPLLSVPLLLQHYVQSIGHMAPIGAAAVHTRQK